MNIRVQLQLTSRTVMNGEKSTLSSPMASFATKRMRTLEALIDAIRTSYV